jgi:hypothetical protein
MRWSGNFGWVWCFAPRQILRTRRNSGASIPDKQSGAFPGNTLGGPHCDFASLHEEEQRDVVSAYRLKDGRCIRSLSGTVSTDWPALRQAARPPMMTNALNPCSRSRCATRALVASRCQVQYR